MTDFHIFEKELTDRLRAGLGNSCQVSARTLCLNNSVKKQAVFITEEGSSITECLETGCLWPLCKTPKDRPSWHWGQGRSPKEYIRTG